MTHFQKIFISNLRYFRTQKGFTQLSFSEQIGVSPNYLNAVENGKNFPSVEVLQNICDKLNLLPYQLFLETPNPPTSINNSESVQKIISVKQQINNLLDELIK